MFEGTEPYLALFFVTLIAYFLTIKQGGFGKVTLLIFLMGLGLFVGLGDMLGGYDRYIYGSLFDSLADNIKYGADVKESTVFNIYSNEPLYGWWNVLMAHFTSNRYIFILISTLLLYALMYRPFTQFVNNYPFGLIVFFGIMFFFTFTYLRQMLAAVILWNAMIYIKERKLIKFTILVIIASGFHNSAVLFWPLYFISTYQYKPWVIIVIMVVALGVGMSGITNNMFQVYGEITQNESRAQEYLLRTGETRWAYILEAVLFTAFILSNYNKLGKTKDITITCNIALIFCVVLLAFCNSENGGRLTWYFILGMISTLTYICTSQRILTRNGIFILILSFALFFRILEGWTFLIRPYKTFLTNGVRNYDLVHELYEYNPKYDEDKFCR